MLHSLCGLFWPVSLLRSEKWLNERLFLVCSVLIWLSGRLTFLWFAGSTTLCLSSYLLCLMMDIFGYLPPAHFPFMGPLFFCVISVVSCQQHGAAHWSQKAGNRSYLVPSFSMFSVKKKCKQHNAYIHIYRDYTMFLFFTTSLES